MLKKRFLTYTSAALAAMTLAGCTPAEPSNKSSAAEVQRALEMRKANAVDRDGYYSRYNTFMKNCLNGSGFRWFDYVPPAQDGRRAPGMRDDDFVKAYGFGVSTLLDSNPAPVDPEQNPNYIYRSSLDGPQRAKYQNVYRGCDQSSWDAVGQSPEKLFQIPSDQAKLLDKADARAATDRRLSEAKREYGECVGRNGYVADTGEELIGTIEEKVAPYRKKYDEAVRRTGDRSLKVAEVLSGKDLKELRAIQALELDMAAVDRTCGEVLYPVAKQVQKEWTEKALNGEL
ncbi:hypothetical protein [Micromonospora chersina]|uniref:hypothetical protein n=1 Tax=Micromonospora chersina TaxID=47854 RepID=UPI0037122C29